MARDLERQTAIGERLKALRESRPDLTQPKIAEYVGVGTRAYQFWEAGDTGIDHANVVKLAELFHVTTSYIYDGGDEPRMVSPDVLVRLEEQISAVQERLAAMDGDRSQLDRMEAKLDLLLLAAVSSVPPDEAFADELERQAEPLLEPRPVPDTKPRAGRRDTTGR